MKKIEGSRTYLPNVNIALKFWRVECNLTWSIFQRYIKLPQKLGKCAANIVLIVCNLFLLYRLMLQNTLYLLYFWVAVFTLKINAKIVKLDTAKWQSSQSRSWIFFLLAIECYSILFLFLRVTCQLIILI